MIHFLNLMKGLLGGTRAITVQPYTEANVKNGLQFYLRRAFTGASTTETNGGFTSSDSMRYIFVNIGGLGILVKDRTVKYIGEEFKLSLYSGATVSQTRGEITVSNYRADGKGEPATLSAFEVFPEDITSFGSSLTDPEYYFGSNSSGQRDANSLPSGRERVLAPGTYLIEIELTDGNTGRFEYFLDWYQGEPDLPRKEI